MFPELFFDNQQEKTCFDNVFDIFDIKTYNKFTVFNILVHPTS